MSANNCETCDYSKYEHEGGHCYMFRTEPKGACMQHTALKASPTPLLDLLRRLRQSGQGPAS